MKNEPMPAQGPVDANVMPLGATENTNDGLQEHV